MKKSIALIVAVVLCCTVILKAQDPFSLIEKLEKITKEKEPDWTLDRKLPTDQIVVVRWSSGEARIFLSIFLTGSSDKAKEAYASSARKMKEDAGPGVPLSTVPDLGEENQLWSATSEGSAKLIFRQGKTHVLLFAPTDDVAKRFGRYVSDLFPRPKKPSAQIGTPNWKQYSSNEGRFSILFPGEPTEETQVVDVAPGVQLKLRVAKHTTIAECSVMYSDYPMPVEDPAVARSVLDAGAKGAADSINAELLELKEISLDGYPGRFMKERLVSKEIMRAKMYLVGQRLYQIAITTPQEEGMSPELSKSYEAMADKFLNSFKVAKREDKKLSARVLIYHPAPANLRPW